jgi:hypothetical protein
MNYLQILYTNIEQGIKLAAELASMKYDDPRINEISDLKGFPISLEHSKFNVRTDNYVLITDQMNEVMNQLIEARKNLLLLGIQGKIFSQETTHAEKVQTHPEDIRL